MNNSDITRLDRLVEKHLLRECTQNESDELDQLYDTFATELDESLSGKNATTQ